MKCAKLMFAAISILLPSLTAAQLGSSQTIVADVPFGFMISNRLMPSGRYAVQSATLNATAFMILEIATPKRR
jgi:hypothetical protein